jgi:tetratricopeptide (TPR) repeat protein
MVSVRMAGRLTAEVARQFADVRIQQVLRRRSSIRSSLPPLGARTRRRSNANLMRQQVDRRPETVRRDHRYRIAAQIDPASGGQKETGQAYLEVKDSAHALAEFVRAADLLPSDVDVQLTAGTLLQRAGRFEDGRSRALRALALDPSNIDAALLGASTLVGLKDLDGAVAQMEEAIRIDPTQSRYFSALGGFELSRGQIKDAEQAFRKAVALDPRSPRAQIALGYYFWSTGRLREAESTFKTALSLDPHSALVNRILTTLLLATNRVTEAEPYLRTLAQIQRRYGLTLTDYYLAQRRFNDAEQVLQSLVSDGSVQTQVRLRFAALRLSQGRVADADDSIDAVLLDEPRNASALLAKAQTLIARDRIADAIPQARAAAEADPQNVQARYVLGKLYVETSQPSPAIKAFNEVLQINPRAASALVELAKLYRCRRSELESRGRRGAAERPESELRILLARGHLGAGDIRRAEPEIRNLLKTYPRSAAVQHWRARCTDPADLPSARKAFEQALHLDVDHREALVQLVNVYAETNNLEAHRIIERGCKNPHRYRPAHPRRPYYATEETSQCRTDLEKVIAQDSTNISAFGMLGEIYISERRLERHASIRSSWRKIHFDRREHDRRMILEAQRKRMRQPSGT